MRFFARLVSCLFLFAAVIFSACHADFPFAGGENQKNQELIIRMLDIGQGDAILLEKGGKFALIDSGDVEHRSQMAEWLRKYGAGELETVIITHPHIDHLGGMLSVFAHAKINRIYDNGEPYSSYTYRTYRKVISKKEIPCRTLKAGDRIDLLDGVPFTVMGPVAESHANGEDSRQNNNSIVGQAAYGNFKMLFTGDAEAEEEMSILKTGVDIKSTVLKVGHHGSKTSSTDDFLEAVSPEAALISCGAGNDYGHPSQKTLKKLEARNISVYRTDRNGTITVTTDGKGCRIEKER